MIFSKGRPLDYLRVSLTPKCNFNCMYCMPEGDVTPFPGKILLNTEKKGPLDGLSTEEWIRLISYFISEQGVKTIRFTGGEPLLSPHLEPILRAIRHFDIDTSVTTNAFLLEGRAESLKDAGLKRLNISLDTLKPEIFARISTRGHIENVLAGIERALTVGFEKIKINSLLLRGINDSELEDLVRFALDRNLEIRFMELMAIGVMSSNANNYRVTSEEVRKRLSRHFAITETTRPVGSPAETFKLEDPQTGKIIPFGLISPVSQSFCSDCRRLRINYKGELIPCLMLDKGLDLKPFAQGKETPYLNGIIDALHACADEKPWKDPVMQASRLMTHIGG